MKSTTTAHLGIGFKKNEASLHVQAADCIHIPPSLGREKTGTSPVNRAKSGTKRSIVSDRNGVTFGLALGSGNNYDSTLLRETLISVPSFVCEKCDWAEMYIDAAYDS